MICRTAVADPRQARITKGVDAVVHFGGQSDEHDWDHILAANIIGFSPKGARFSGDS